MKVAVALLFAFLFAACSPSLDWREVSAPGDGYKVLLPARPSADSRKVVLAGATVDMSMRGADVEQVTYAVGTALFASEEQATRAAQEMQEALLRNIAATEPVRKTIVVDQLALTEVRASGKTPAGAPVILHARFAVRGKRAYQAVVFGPASRVKPEAADTFLESFHPGRP